VVLLLALDYNLTSTSRHSNSGLRGLRRTYRTTRSLRPELDGQDVEVRLYLIILLLIKGPHDLSPADVLTGSFLAGKGLFNFAGEEKNSECGKALEICQGRPGEF
jgi:hypothetical protein